jgi:hypothetical protein
MPEVQLSPAQQSLLTKAGIDPANISFGDILMYLKLFTELLERFNK